MSDLQMGPPNPLIPPPTTQAKTPADFLKSIKGKPVVVKLNSGVDYRGKKPDYRDPLCQSNFVRLPMDVLHSPARSIA